MAKLAPRLTATKTNERRRYRNSNKSMKIKAIILKILSIYLPYYIVTYFISGFAVNIVLYRTAATSVPLQ
jgi:hypothetical protein